jgi:hypothetical protein
MALWNAIGGLFAGGGNKGKDSDQVKLNSEFYRKLEYWLQGTNPPQSVGTYGTDWTRKLNYYRSLTGESANYGEKKRGNSSVGSSQMRGSGGGSDVAGILSSLPKYIIYPVVAVIGYFVAKAAGLFGKKKRRR